jgi:hypothetical protein
MKLNFIDHSSTQKAAAMFKEAARQDTARNATPDPDVYIALGLLYNLSFEYEKATQCFKV